MRVTRRRMLGMGGGLVAALSLAPFAARSGDAVEIVMAGRRDGSRVWFDPVGLRIAPGQTVRWVNRDAGNAHTATAYHPANGDRPRRIPDGAPPWDSDYLLPGETFAITLEEPGVYDYFCVPHERAGMAGRIVVGAAAAAEWPDDDGVPEAVLDTLPPVDAIVRAGIVRPG